MADQGAQGLLSPFLRNQRIAAARPYLEGRILDVGCGAGSLAQYVNPQNYIGVDMDAVSLKIARRRFPEHVFYEKLEDNVEEEYFDTVVALAVIEHVPSPTEFLLTLTKYLRADENARIICTTPHPSMDWVHGLGARIGLFSRAANEEHEELLDRTLLMSSAQKAGLTLLTYKRFLMGANQIAVFGQADLQAA